MRSSLLAPTAPEPHADKADASPGSRAYCHPDNFSGVTNLLYRQNADGTFEDVSNKAGISDPSGKALGIALADFDNDGRTDVFVANDSVRQSLYRNNGNGTFSDIAVVAGAGFNENGKIFAGMGVDAADFNNDGLIDVFITTLANETYALFQNNGDLSFTWVTNTLGVGQISLIYTGWELDSLTLTTMDGAMSLSPRVMFSTRSNSQQVIFATNKHRWLCGIQERTL